MVAFNTLPKLCLVVAFGLSTTATSTEVAQEQPKKESFLSRFFGKKEGPAAKTVDVKEPTKTDTQEHNDTRGLFMYDVEWLLESKPENRAALRKALPSDIAKDVPEDCNKRMWSGLEEYISKFFKFYAIGWYLLPEPESRCALRYVLPPGLAAKVPEDCNVPIKPEVEKDIRKLFSETFQKQGLRREWNTGHMFSYG
ncbi:SmORF protein [Babesia bovis T2Bo]|uniref:SmORF n=1 Tax=Babesia bovis TaxID=5865 RepID=A7AUX8_BABBO|nr:SmORF protein [Babesia bovis T2Bo]EDO05604.1 SmORF protein [Babesia bovis T2Bo]|eukprot:XP_001609172.1 SmORF [Babesia bovis T2Bo]